MDFLAARRRAKRPAAAAPKSRTIGGAGTSVPPVDPPLDPPLDDEDDELDEDEELLLEEDELAPKLDDPPDEEPVEEELVEDEPLEPLLPPEPPSLDDP